MSPTTRNFIHAFIIALKCDTRGLQARAPSGRQIAVKVRGIDW